MCLRGHDCPPVRVQAGAGILVHSPNPLPCTFKDYNNHQILQASGLRHFTFHALRHTFASRAMEQGMDPKTLSEIMGHYSVSFTLDTYAHVLNGHKQEAVALLGDLFTAQPQSTVYPLVVTTADFFCLT